MSQNYTVSREFSTQVSAIALSWRLKIIVSFFVVLTSSKALASTSFNDWGTIDLTFSSDEQISTFLQNNGGTFFNSTVLRTLVLNGTVSNLLPFAELTAIQNLTISTNGSVSGFNNVQYADNVTINAPFSGLNNLLAVTGQQGLQIRAATSGFESLESVTVLSVSQNAASIPVFAELNTAQSINITSPALTQVVGFFGLLECPNLSISNNSSLITISGFNSLSASQISITENPSLSLISMLSNSVSVLSIVIHNNDQLQTISGFSIETIVGNSGLQITGNDILSEISGFGDLVSTTYLSISDNPLLAQVENFGSLTSVFGDFNLNNNDSLVNLQGFNNLSYIQGGYLISNNDQLQSLGGTDNNPMAPLSANSLYLIGNSQLTDLGNYIISVSVAANGGFLYIHNNQLLESLQGLANINPDGITNVIITSCPNLSNCSVASICGYIDNGSIPTASQNATGCNSAQQIVDICQTLNNDSFDSKNAVVWPNPVKNQVNISLSSSNFYDSEVEIFDIAGRKMGVLKMESSIKTFDFTFSTGIYFLRFPNGEKIKLIKQ